MGVNSLPKTVTRQSRDCDLNPGPSVPESSTLTTRLPSHHMGPEKTVKACSERGTVLTCSGSGGFRQGAFWLGTA